MTDEILNIPTDWMDARELCREGQGFPEEELAAPWDRFPARAEGVVRDEVWNLSRQPCGVSIRFTSDAAQLFGDIELEGDVASKNNERLTPMRDIGLDCYGRADDGRWYWVGARVNRWDYPLNRQLLDGKHREYRVYLPIGLPVTSLKIGVSQGARFERATPDPRRPVVYYGTSIVHGRLRFPARHGVHLHPVPPAGLAVRQSRLRRKRTHGTGGRGTRPGHRRRGLRRRLPTEHRRGHGPGTDAGLRKPPPGNAAGTRRSLFVGDRLFGDAAFIPARRTTQRVKSEAQREVFMQLVADGVENLHLLDARNFFGDDFEGTIDGSHPTDLGSMRMADAVEPVLRRLLYRLPA